MWKKIPMQDESLPLNLSRELGRLTEDEQAKVLGYISRDRDALFLNEHASSAFGDILEGMEHIEDIDEPSGDELSSFQPLFASRFKVS